MMSQRWKAEGGGGAIAGRRTREWKRDRGRERERDREWKGTLCSPKKPRRELVGSGSSPFFPGKAKREKKNWKTRKINKINHKKDII